MEKVTKDYLAKLDKEKEENDILNPKCTRCGQRIFGSVYAIEDEVLERDELVFHNSCYDLKYVQDYIKAKKK